MTNPNRQLNEAIRGKRVRLIYSNDIYTQLQPGDCGTINHIDDMGTFHVVWDKGSNLGLVAESGDRWEVVG